tara:strand:- start:1005 stop:1172 length:168 start_codon:yes stop_codon:yes gene_type:complete
MLSKQAQLEKNVVETKAAVSKATDWADAVEAVPAYAKARDELAEYLKEHGDEHSI